MRIRPTQTGYPVKPSHDTEMARILTEYRTRLNDPTLLTGGGVTLVDGWGLYGDSFANGGSGGGGGYYFLATQMSRYLGLLGLPNTVVSYGVNGQDSAAALSDILGRSVQYKELMFWAGRNDNIGGTSQATLVANITARAQAAIASLKPGQRLWLMSIHNFNYNADSAGQGNAHEPSGGSNYTKIVAMNNALAALANGTTVIYKDTRALLVQHAVLSNFQDGLDHDADQPASSTTATDGLHPSAIGYNEIVRDLIWDYYARTTVYAGRTNLVTDTGSAAWLKQNSATLGYSAGVYDYAAVTAFGSVAQQLLSSGASGHRFLYHFNVESEFTGGTQVQARPFTGGGTLFTAVTDSINPFEFGFSLGFESAGLNMTARHNARHVMFFVDANTPQLALLFAANNDATAKGKFSQPLVHQIS